MENFLYFLLTVIASDFVETKDELINEFNGLTFAPNNSVELAKKISQLSLDEKLCKKLGENNYILSKKNHSFSACKKRLYSFLELLVGKYNE